MDIYIETYGCAANQADEAVIKTILKKENFVDSAEKADIIIVLTCGVKGSTENKILARLKKLEGKKVIVGGCLPKILNLQKIFPKFSLIGPDQIGDIKEIVEKTAKGEIIIELSEKRCRHVIPESKEEVQAISIASGCLGKCAFCATKLAKGRLKSFTIDEIVNSVKRAVANGAKKILLTAQDTGVYGLDIETNIVELLREIIQIPGNFKIRVGMMNPKYALKYSNELIEIYKSPKIIKFIHVPVQSGSNGILKKMRRDYTVEEFKMLVKKLRTGIPKLVLATDIICGFPGETEKQFDETIELIKNIKPEVLNISKFYPRPRTEAMSMKLLHTKIVKKRSQRLSEIYKNIRNKVHLTDVN